MAEQLQSIFPEFGERLGPEFSPAELAAMSGVNPETQRLWRSRGIVDDDMRAPYSWQQVMQWAVANTLSKRGNLSDAWRVARDPKVQDYYKFDLRHFDRAPLFLFCNETDEGGALHVSSGAGKVSFDTSHPWWGNYGIHFNFSAVQQRVIAAYVELRKAK